MMALSMTQTSTAAFCMLNREFNEPIFGLLCPIFRGYMGMVIISNILLKKNFWLRFAVFYLRIYYYIISADCESKVDELSLLLMILPNESDCDTWKECLNYVAYQANNDIEDSISQKSLLTPWTSWNNAGSFSKDTAMQLKKFALRGLIKELDSPFHEIERILDHASILGHRPHWLIDVLQYCASLSKTEDMAKAITKWAKQIKALYSSSN
uniref:E3 ubiquitin-protein ligase listerin n=1 Tax=Heterorhabditis bacteriophora TaxID=37862 RepID=A0A1I7XR66_HETBA